MSPEAPRTRSHPRLYAAATLQTPGGSARALGFHMPAEWEPHEAVWVAPPHNEETWPGCLDEAQRQFDDFLSKLREVTAVRDVSELHVATNDSWMRDFGPIFVCRDHPAPDTRPTEHPGPDTRHPTPGATLADSLCPGLAGGIALHDFHFDGWGGKYEVRAADDCAPQHIAAEAGLPIWIHDWVLEGGAIEVNGSGTVMTTAQCLLDAGRNPRMSRAQLEHAIHEALGAHHLIYLPGGIAGDDTDGHIDDVARFIDARTLAAVSPPPDHPDYAICQRNLTALRDARDQNGEALHVVALPAPPPMDYDFPADRFQPGGRAMLPASYANFLISNGAVFVPTFGAASDDAALKALDDAMPGHRIEPVRCDRLVVGLGTLHCLTMQQPSPRRVDR